jgi:hypothetical protein
MMEEFNQDYVILKNTESRYRLGKTNVNFIKQCNGNVCVSNTQKIAMKTQPIIKLTIY